MHELFVFAIPLIYLFSNKNQESKQAISVYTFYPLIHSIIQSSNGLTTPSIHNSFHQF